LHAICFVLQGTAGAKKFVDKNGFLYNSVVVLNLKSVAAGWHSLTVDGSTADPVKRGTQTGKSPNPCCAVMRLC
jgi:hypothetical protein